MLRKVESWTGSSASMRRISSLRKSRGSCGGDFGGEAGAQFGQDEGGGLRMLLEEIGREYVFRNARQLLPHARIGAAQNIRQDVGDLLGRKCAGQQLLGFSGIAEKIEAVGEMSGEFFDQRLQHRRRHGAQSRALTS